MREAQFAFVVILLLLGVLVYVAIHRVSGRKFRFRQIAQTAPVAQHIGENAYPAQTIIDHEERFSQDTLRTPQSIAVPESDQENRTNPTIVSASTQTFSPRQQPSAPAVKTQPTTPGSSAAAAAVTTTEHVAQAQFIELPKTKPETNPAPKRHRTISKPDVDDPFEKINGSSSTAARPLAFEPRERNHDLDSSKKPVPQSPEFEKAAHDSTADFRPPPIKSDFGAGSTRELPSFATPTKKEQVKVPVKEPLKETASFDIAPISPTPALKPTPTPTFTPPKQTHQQANVFAPLKKKASTPAQAFALQETPEAKAIIRKQIAEARPQQLGHRDYRVQTTDSLWSIALDHYGDGRFFRALHEHNIDRIASADRLEPNTMIEIPEVDELIKRYADLCPADKLGADELGENDDLDDELPDVDYDRYQQSMDERFHITQTGDTLFDVARKRLGQASRYLEIFELNRFRIPQDVNHLTPLDPGLRLLLPQ